MTKKKNTQKKLRSETVKPPVEKTSVESGLAQYIPSAMAVRETVESVVIAFILAFLFRTFEAEAFVIPTGSMAPTLAGRHKDLQCPECGYWYRASASCEVNSQSGASLGENNRVVGCTCPMCRYPMDLRIDGPKGTTYPSYKGDQILVNKLAYQFSEPKRFDVAVFKYPADAKTNYIKRMVGLPRETVCIHHGNLYTKADDESEFHIQRKPNLKLLAMLEPVYDNEVAPKIIEDGWPARWQADRRSQGWDDQTDNDPRTFTTPGTSEATTWIRYRHLLPSPFDWQQKQKNIPTNLVPHLITDFVSYNTNRTYGGHRMLGASGFGQHWVGDLVISCSVDIKSDKGTLLFELVKGGELFQCRLDIATGQARFSIEGIDSYAPTAATAVRGAGEYEVRFANVDDQLLLWIDDNPVSFDKPTSYEDLRNSGQVRVAIPTLKDLQPVGIASEGAALTVSRLKIDRDIYYIAMSTLRENRDTLGNRYPADSEYGYRRSPEFLSAANYTQWPDIFGSLLSCEFHLDEDQFLMLGDNSACSKDSRLWAPDVYYVQRRLLIGKALFVHWPHSWNRIPKTNIPFPYFPNFSRMGPIR